jgi:P pilus assembly chaperone PapD
MYSLPRFILGAAALAGTALTLAAPASAGVGDLLVAPTRIVLDGRSGSEIILNNIGEEAATYRISVELRRMTPDGRLEEVKDPSATDKIAQDMIMYNPRRVTLAPNQPQSIRIAARAPQGLPDGEYRVHLLFRAIPKPKPVVETQAEAPKGLSFEITPIYGVTIPVIVRLGQLQVQAGIANVRLDQRDGKKAVSLELTRSGQRSTFGEVRVLKNGVKEPIAIQRAVAVYTDIGTRKLSLPINEEFKGDVRGPVTVQYVETFVDGNRTIAETQAVLQ